MQARKSRLPGCGALVLAVLSIAPLAGADAGAGRDRPRVGLVLGGGGARGAAHIGVLKELERQRIPIDAIAGTSMGAIVGGLYAAGMSAAELEDLVATLDWADMLDDESARRLLSFRRKLDDAGFPIHFELGVRGGKLLLPMGAVQGQRLDLVLRELTIGVSHIHNFDELPIPFRAIASDIERGEPWVMGEGDLARSIRASMSVPGVFAPVRIGDHLLVDGGIVGNLPIDVIREMDVDVVIAVDVEFPLYRGDELDSVLTISEQMLTILIRKDTLRQIATLDDDDILIRPALGTFPSSNFGAITEAIEPGVRAAQAAADKLRGLSVDASAYAAYEAHRTRKPPTDDTIAFVRVAHDGRIRPAILESRLETRPGDRVDPARLADDAERLYGLGLYEQVGYRLVEEKGRTGVEFQPRSKSWGPDTLQFSLALEDDVQGSTSFNVGTRLTRAALNPHGGEWRTDLQLGTEPQLASELYQPFGSASTLFVEPRVALWQSNFDTFESGGEIARLRLSETEGGIDFGTEIGDLGEIRLGAYRGFGSARVRIGDPAIPDFDFDTGGIFARLRIDTLDNARFPRRGVWADFRWSRSLPGLGADDRFDAIETELLGAWSRGKNSWSAGLSYQTTTDGVSQVQDQFPLGGFLRLSGLEHGEIRGPNAALGRVVYHRRVGESAGELLDVPVYVGTSLEAGNVWPSRADIDLGSLNVGGSVFVGLDSYLGPIYLAAGFVEGGRRNFYLFIGSPPR